MDRSEKLAISLSGGLLAVFFAAILYASSALDIEVPTCITDVEPFTEDALFEIAENEYELHMIARMWAFQPSEITLPAGSTVHIYVTSPDIIHGFKVERKNVNLMAVPDAVNYIKVRFDEPGEYFFACHEYCGVGHHSMAGSFRIVESGSEELSGGEI